MRLGAYVAELVPGSQVAEAYGHTVVSERHRHRYEFNPRLPARSSTTASSPARVRRPTAGWWSSSSSRATRSGSAPRPTPSSRAGPTGPAPLFRGAASGASLRAGRRPVAAPVRPRVRPRRRVGVRVDLVRFLSRVAFEKVDEELLAQGFRFTVRAGPLPGARRHRVRARHRAPPRGGGRASPPRRRHDHAGPPVPRRARARAAGAARGHPRRRRRGRRHHRRPRAGRGGRPGGRLDRAAGHVPQLARLHRRAHLDLPRHRPPPRSPTIARGSRRRP